MGRALVARLLEEGRAVRVLERRPSDAFDGLAVERVTGDVTQPETLAAACAGAETVFNLAGVLSYDAKDEARLQAVNVDGLANLLAAARQAGSGRVVQVSSVAAVGYTDDPARPQDEDSPFPEGAWRNRYARSKRLGEEVAHARRRRGAGRRRGLSRLPARPRRRQPHQHVRGRGVPARLPAHHGRGRALLRRRARRRGRAAGRGAPRA